MTYVIETRQVSRSHRSDGGRPIVIVDNWRVSSVEHPRSDGSRRVEYESMTAAYRALDRFRLLEKQCATSAASRQINHIIDFRIVSTARLFHRRNSPMTKEALDKWKRNGPRAYWEGRARDLSKV